MKVAALDLGTNSFLCLIAEGREGKIENILSDEVQIVRLGQSVNETKMFHPEALNRAKKTLTDFSISIQKHKVDKVLAMATSAARDVKNKMELFQICDDLKIPLEIIAGEDEARITYKGALAGKVLDTKKSYLIIDIGGGSTELIVGQGDRLLFAESINIGAVRLKEMFLPRETAADEELKKMENFIHQQLVRPIEKIKKLNVSVSYSVAGTPTELASMALGGFDKNKIENYPLTVTALREWIKKFQPKTSEEKIKEFKVNPGRADIIIVGAQILYQILVELDLSQTLVGTQGVRFGIAQELLEESES